MTRLSLVLRNGLLLLVLGLMATQLGCPSAEPKKTAKPAGEAKPQPAAPSTEQPPSKPGAQPADAPPATKPAEAAASVTPKPPLGLPPVPVPADNPITAAKVELGKMLYFDKRLSKDGTVSCATCHAPKIAWAEHEPTSKGVAGQLGQRNAPTVLNSAYATSQFWDGRAKTLEEQALGPIANPIEMGHELEQMIQDLSKLDGYVKQFQAVFGTGVTQEGVAKAIAAFERTVLSGNSPYDRFKAGDKTALTEQQQRGMSLFEDNCAMCHTPPLLSNYRFFNAGVGMDKEKPDAGRMTVTKSDRDLGKFRVPTLRDVADTAPYFHDGSAATLEEAVDLMADGGRDNPNLSTQLKAIREAKLTEADQKDIVAFLKSLSGEFPVVEEPKLP